MHWCDSPDDELTASCSWVHCRKDPGDQGGRGIGPGPPALWAAIFLKPVSGGVASRAHQGRRAMVLPEPGSSRRSGGSTTVAGSPGRCTRGRRGCILSGNRKGVCGNHETIARGHRRANPGACAPVDAWTSSLLVRRAPAAERHRAAGGRPPGRRDRGPGRGSPGGEDAEPRCPGAVGFRVSQRVLPGIQRPRGLPAQPQHAALRPCLLPLEGGLRTGWPSQSAALPGGGRLHDLSSRQAGERGRRDRETVQPESIPRR